MESQIIIKPATILDTWNADNFTNEDPEVMACFGTGILRRPQDFFRGSQYVLLSL